MKEPATFCSAQGNRRGHVSIFNIRSETTRRTIDGNSSRYSKTSFVYFWLAPGTITGNVIKKCEGSAIGNGGLNNDIVISGNVIENTNSVVSAAAIQLTNAARILITGKTITETALNPAIAARHQVDTWNFRG
jgi:hypothetical protein